MHRHLLARRDEPALAIHDRRESHEPPLDDLLRERDASGASDLLRPADGFLSAGVSGGPEESRRVTRGLDHDRPLPGGERLRRGDHRPRRRQPDTCGGLGYGLLVRAPRDDVVVGVGELGGQAIALSGQLEQPGVP